MSQNGKRHDDFTPYLWKSTDCGKSWQNLAAKIPSGPINVVREDPKNANVLYVGTDLGVYVSVDAGQSWDVLATDLPTTFVSDLIIHPRDDMMVISTHGRGIYALDVRPIQEFGKEKEEPKEEGEEEKKAAEEEESEEEDRQVE